ncbi:threonine--tRNA ligase [Candidatus Sumerlaeota bacterium]|nr:threonine--tRNA ligase [Candidatus Sumerlaeota bacterium]
MSQLLNIKLPDGSVKQTPKGTTVYEFAKSIGSGLAKAALGAKINNDKLIGLSDKLEDDCAISILTWKDEEGRSIYRHTAAHVMAQAVKRLFPNVKLTIGPPLDDSYYYDFDLDQPLTVEDLEKIDAEVEKVVSEAHEIKRIELPRAEAIAYFEKRGEPYKIEIINELPEDAIISIYEQGEFADLCRGPHMPNTSAIKANKLLSVAGAYWRADAKNKMLQRVYGTAFPDKKQLDEHLRMLEEARKRDHRKIGRELDLFSFQDEGPGFPFFHPNGMIVYNELMDFLREKLVERNYKEIRTPMILNESLWHRSGHWDHYQENMYFTKIDDGDYAVKPMNCPGCMLVYRQGRRSYRELPLKFAEFGLVHRHEMSGVLHGLFRVRCFTQDDAHIFCTEDQLEQEVIDTIALIKEVYETFGFTEYHMELSTRPEDSQGSDEIWEMATTALENSLKHLKVDYKLNPGDGAFYGPKIDFHVKDALGRSWQCATIQVDFSMPERFDLNYIGQDGLKHRPVMVHRAVFGSIERFLGMLIEQTVGNFPVWLAPVQVAMLPISEKSLDFARKIANELSSAGIRVTLNAGEEKIGAKIRDAEMAKIPYMLVVGEKEAAANSVSVRRHGKGDMGVMAIEDFKTKIQKEIKERTL